MANTDRTLWPYNTESNRTSHRIDWLEIEPEAMATATPSLIRACDEADLKKLRTDIRFARLLEALPPSCKELVTNITTGTAPVKRERSEAADTRGQIKQELRRILSEAEASSDFSAQLKALETEGKLDALFNEKKPEKDESSLAERLRAARRRLSGTGG